MSEAAREETTALFGDEPSPLDATDDDYLDAYRDFAFDRVLRHSSLDRVDPQRPGRRELRRAGAKADSWFSHVAIAVPGEDTSNEWLEPVDDETYGALSSR